MKAESSLKQKLQVAGTRLAAQLVDAKSLSNEQARRIIANYAAAVEGNFIAWLGAGLVTARSHHAEFAIKDNIYEEIEGNHPGMLRDFACSASALPDACSYEYVSGAVDRMRSLVAEMVGLQSIALLTCLENFSLYFIPYLAELAGKLGSKDFAYTDAHGAADVEHADLFLWALEQEMMLYQGAEDIITRTLDETEYFLKFILIPMHD